MPRSGRDSEPPTMPEREDMKGKIVAIMALLCSAPTMAEEAIPPTDYIPPTEECRSSPFRPWASCDKECSGLFADPNVIFGTVLYGAKINGKTCDARPRTPK